MTPRSQDSIAHSPDIVQGIRKKKLAGAGASLLGQSPRASQNTDTAPQDWQEDMGYGGDGVHRKGSLENVTLSWIFEEKHMPIRGGRGRQSLLEPLGGGTGKTRGGEAEPFEDHGGHMAMSPLPAEGSGCHA